MDLTVRYRTIFRYLNGIAHTRAEARTRSQLLEKIFMGETSDTDPESGAFFPPAGSGMNIPDHIYESLETNFWALLKIL
jgi:hypothetical protein